MSDQLGFIPTSRLSGKETFKSNDQSLGFDVLSFWQWSMSDLVSNTARGVLAEYIIARALNKGTDEMRREWDAYDLDGPNNLKVEVKSAAFIQSWHQKKFSAIQFRVAKKKSWDAKTNTVSSVPERPADVYIFALLAHKDQKTLNPLKVDQWEFYVLPTEVLDDRKRSQHSITLNSLRGLTDPVDYDSLSATVQRYSD